MLRKIIVLLLILMGGACNQSVQRGESKRAETTAQKMDGSSPIPPFNDSLSADLVAWKTYFGTKDGDRIDSMQKIPRSLMARFIKGPNFDTVGYVSTVNPIDVFGNKYGYFFLIKVNCSYGGACANFYLLSFDKTERYRQTQPLGDEAGAESFISLFSYKLCSDTVLATWVVRY